MRLWVVTVVSMMLAVLVFPAGPVIADEGRPSQGDTVGAGTICHVGYTTVCYPEAGPVWFEETPEYVHVVVALRTDALGINFAECRYDKSMSPNDADAYEGRVGFYDCWYMELDVAWVPETEGPGCRLQVRMEDSLSHVVMDAVGVCR